MPINQLTTANTFSNWLTATQSLIETANTLTNGNGATFTANTKLEVNGTGAVLNVRTSGSINVFHSNTGTFGNLITTNVTTSNVILSNNIIFSDSTKLNSASFITASFAQANAAFSYANSAFAAANSAGTYANSAFLHANTSGAGAYANSGFAIANSASYTANSAASYANSAFVHANSAFTSSNTKATSANPIFTGQAAFADGSAAAPSITNDGDTNTGLYFPAENIIAISTDGAESFRANATGTLMIGTTSVLTGTGSDATPGLNVKKAGMIIIQNSTEPNMNLAKVSGYTSEHFVKFNVNGTNIGEIKTDGSVVQFVGSLLTTNWTVFESAGNLVFKNGAATKVTFTSSGATGNTQSNGDNSTKFATTAYVQNMGLGWGQTWQDVLASREKSKTYTNSTGKPIMVKVFMANVGASSDAYLYVDGIIVDRQNGDTTNGGAGATMSAIVPSGSTYKVEGTRTLTGGIWVELR